MTSGLENLSVLVMDDSAQMRTIIGTVLAAVGIRGLYYAGDGRQGLEIVGRAPIDLVYADYEMPVMDGLTFLSAIRALPGQEQYMPVIMVTGHSDARRLRLARDLGVTEFLGKPVTTASILNRLDAVILRPRPFVRARDFFGPERRRRRATAYDGPRRRGADDPPVTGI
jgi:two-component system chemotaxis response regulator CheY